MKKRKISTLLTLVATLAFSILGPAKDVTPPEARAIAKEAAIYGFPLHLPRNAPLLAKDRSAFRPPAGRGHVEATGHR